MEERDIFIAMAEMHERLSTAGANPGLENMCKLGTTIQSSRGDNERRMLIVSRFKSIAGERWELFKHLYTRQEKCGYSSRQCGRIGGMLGHFWRDVNKNEEFRREVVNCASIFNRQMGAK